MKFKGCTEEELRKQLGVPKREGELVNPHITIERRSATIDYTDISRRIGKPLPPLLKEQKREDA